MFRVENLRISFRHEYFHISENTGKPVYEGTGRFGVTCFIAKEGRQEDMCIGIGSVLIHKGDQPDRILGKKYALRKALIKQAYFVGKRHIIVWRLEKEKRTKIWKAFWTWTETWKPLKVKFTGRVDTITIPPLLEQHDIGAQISICLDTKNLADNIDNINDLLGAEAVVTIERTSK